MTPTQTASRPLKLMAVLAHPDDESLGIGGTLAKYADEGVETYLVTATRGERGRFGESGEKPSPDVVGRVREAELREAAGVLGVREVRFLDYYDGDLDQANVTEAVAANRRNFRQRIHRACADRAGGADNEKRKIAEGEISIDLCLECGRVHLLPRIDGNPANGIGAKSKQVGRFLKPCMRLGRGICQQPRLIRKTFRSHVPRGLRSAGREEAHKICHVAAAHQETAAAGGISDELSNPPNGLRFYFGGERREPECADILVDHRR